MMPATYEGTLHDNQIDWDGVGPQSATNGRAVRVQVTVLGEIETREDQGRMMALALERIAKLPPSNSIPNPLEWQREQRMDRTLPGRDE